MITDFYTQLVQFATILSGFATAGALIFVGYETMALRAERKETHRAWIGDAGSHIMLFRILNENGKSLSKAEWDVMTAPDKLAFNPSEYEYAIKLKNFGQVTAMNVKGRYGIYFDELPKRKKIESSDFGFPFVLLPDDEQLYIFSFNREIGDVMSTGSRKLYMINEIQYSSGSSKLIRKYGFIANMSPPAYFKLDSWDEKSYDKQGLV